jgi:hypothetical protein
MADFIFPLRKKPAANYHTGGRTFGADRTGGRKHAGCDLIAPQGTEILAMANGEVIRGPYEFYEGTYALEIKHANGMVVRYGEISQTVPVGIKEGTRVSRGQVIARVGRLDSGSSMLHLEMYNGNVEGPLTQTGNSYKRRTDLFNPTSYLDDAPLGDSLSEVADAAHRMGRVNDRVTSTLKVRDKASTDSVILYKLAPGATCTILEDVTGSPYLPDNAITWYKIEHEGQQGFVAADFIDVVVAGQAPPQTPTIVDGRVNHRVTNKLRVRAEASVSSAISFELAPGTTFKVLEEVQGESYDFGRTDWCKIEHDGRQGFAAAYYIDIQSQPKPQTRWDRALPQAPTVGASAETAWQDHLPPGVQSSRDMAQADLQRVKAIADLFCTAAAKFGVPAAVLAAVASRESRCGKVLSSTGWGDKDNAFGIMQVDKRFHKPAGQPDPGSREHIEQATGIFVDYLEGVQKKHPDWEDPYLLKGAAVAYNAGVKTVQTKDGMDIGTTGNDYGSDVMARAQYYANHSELAVFRTES